MQRGQHWQRQLPRPLYHSLWLCHTLCALSYLLSSNFFFVLLFFRFFFLPLSAQPAKVFAAICVSRLGFVLCVLTEVSLTELLLLLPQRAVHRLCQFNLLLSRLKDFKSACFKLLTSLTLTYIYLDIYIFSFCIYCFSQKF